MQFPIALTLLEPLVKPQLGVSPSSLALTSPAGAVATQNFQISNPSASDLVFQATAANTWLSVSPTTGIVPANGELNLTVKADPTGLTASAIYSSSVSAMLPDGTLSMVSVTLTVATPSACNAPTVSLEFLSPSAQSTVTLGEPVSIKILAEDQCGNPLTQTSKAGAIFSNGDAAISLVAIGNGLFEGTWFPRSGNGGQTVTISAIVVGLPPFRRGRREHYRSQACGRAPGSTPSLRRVRRSDV